MKCSACPRPSGLCPGELNPRVCTYGDRAEIVAWKAAEPAQPPPLAARMQSLAAAVVAHVVSGGAAPPSVAAARLAICRTNLCGMYSDAGGPACLACGCSARGLAVKVTWAEQSCPLQPPLWGPVEPA